MFRPSRRGRAQRWIVISLFCCASLQVGFAQTEEPKREQVQPQKLVVKVLDGITGLPMWFEFPNIWIGSANDVNPRLNIRGEVQFDVREAKPRTVQLLPNWYADCRFKGDTTVGKTYGTRLMRFWKMGSWEKMSVDGLMRSLRLELLYFT
jgi:hypothetical protein